ncbi:Fe-S cluster assembly sulfur transfer protein SufU [Mycobacterium sp. CnD-18-1]|uniref:Fe-S cluster assembly sulfur transfer protein SufU n=1 Tax=Mycobacterium sp. CnD-18-1 TaxID=2917744 RepID=UPI001EF1F243|nr:SUF system NifU family Fe-S cluster assembly protein [Mycobacterium sp. CnD-18-1]MCG7607169.1 SUF system NifU family Fe-S cluster assembly protein [Mycobacterium sp. CnD-18-1]
MDVNALYRGAILEHHKSPRNVGLIADATAEGRKVNATCGDEIAFQVRVDANVIEDIGWTGEGCSISRAAASALAESAEGMTVDAAADLVGAFLDAFLGGGSIDALPGDLPAFGVAARYPARVGCALLGCRALAGALGVEA